jgi:hypothetical protein
VPLCQLSHNSEPTPPRIEFANSRVRICYPVVVAAAKSFSTGYMIHGGDDAGFGPKIDTQIMHT